MQRVAHLLLLVVMVWLPAQRVVAAPASDLQASVREASDSSAGLLRELLDAVESGGRLLIEMVGPQDSATAENPRWNSLESPRQTVQTFMETMHYIEQGHDEVWPRALATLGRVHTENPALARRRARELYEVLLRVGSFDAFSLPGASDVERSGMTRYEVFPRGVDHAWVWKTLDQPPEGTVTLVRGRKGSWTFSNETQQGLTALYRSLAPLPPQYDNTHEKAFVSVFVPTVSDTAWWGWLAAAGGFLVGFLVAWIVRRVGVHISERLESAGYSVTASVVRSLSVPGALLMFTASVATGLAFLHLTGVLDQLRWGFLELLIFVALGWLAIELLDFVFVRYKTRARNNAQKLNSMAAEIAHRLMKIGVVVLLIAMVLQNVFGFDVAPVVAGIGVLGLAMSLAAKDSIKNVFGALMIFLYRPFVLGDHVRFEGQIGTVMELGTQSTTIRLLTGERLTVPNMKFVSSSIENLSARPYVRGEVEVALSYHCSTRELERALELLRQIMRTGPVATEGMFRLDERPPEIHFTQFSADVLKIQVYYWYYMGEKNEDKERDLVQRDVERNWWSFLEHRTLVHRTIHERFAEEDIEFAFPTQTVELELAKGLSLPQAAE